MELDSSKNLVFRNHIYLGMLRNAELILQTTNVHKVYWHESWSSW